MIELEDLLTPRYLTAGILIGLGAFLLTREGGWFYAGWPVLFAGMAVMMPRRS